MPAAAPVNALMRTLSDPTRRAIYERVARGEATVRVLTERSGVSQPAVSQHLKVLQDARLVVGRKEGRNVFYRANPEGLKPLAAWMQAHKAFWEQSFERLGDYLNELKRNDA